MYSLLLLSSLFGGRIVLSPLGYGRGVHSAACEPSATHCPAFVGPRQVLKIYLFIIHAWIFISFIPYVLLKIGSKKKAGHCYSY